MHVSSEGIWIGLDNSQHFSVSQKTVDRKKHLHNGFKVWRKTPPSPHQPGVKCVLVYTPALKRGKYDRLADHPVFVSDTGQESLQQQSLPTWRNLPQPPRFLFDQEKLMSLCITFFLSWGDNASSCLKQL